ncbi:MAG: hypothetical protein CMJ18_14845 [Phycisphaeraceae bacterium]|nr:hypothetical protein [Phycisphaeraceae bacterium]
MTSSPSSVTSSITAPTSSPEETSTRRPSITGTTALLPYGFSQGCMPCSAPVARSSTTAPSRGKAAINDRPSTSNGTGVE